jgi:glutathione synthase
LFKKSLLDKLSTQANSYAAAHGVQVEQRQTLDASDTTATKTSYQCAPISLLPNAFPATAFRQAQSLAVPFNELVDRISRDGAFLNATLGDVGEIDRYTGKLLDLYMDIYCSSDKDDNNHKEHPRRGEEWGKFARMADRLGILRSDYMLNPSSSQTKNHDEEQPPSNEKEIIQYELKQIELNTIASSFAGLSANVAGLHRHLVGRYESEVHEFLEENKRAVMGTDYAGLDDDTETEGVPINPALECIPGAMNVAHENYKERFLANHDPSPVVLFVVQEGETNTVDQRMLEFSLWERHGVPVVRMSLTRAATALELNEKTGALTIKANDDENIPFDREVSLVYFRAGYAPTDYPDGDDGIEWMARETMERSRATKCPCLGYHLAGTKKVQQELARPGVLERFFFPEEQPLVDGMREAFAGLYSLGPDATDVDIAAVRRALGGHEGQYVLKPQREGGGYNFYGDQLVQKLRENIVSGRTDEDSIELGSDLSEFILMERLFPPQQTAVLLRAGLVEGTGDSISELGCFGTVVASHDGQVLHSVYAGFLLRTKYSNVDEGGVASGFATLSSPYLC